MSSNNKNPYITYENNYKNNNNNNSIDAYTTFVHANPSNFRAVVQRLTGSSSSFSSATTPLSRPVSDNTAAFKLHERRQQQGAMRKLEMIKLNNNHNKEYNQYHHGPTNIMRLNKRGNSDIISPVSTLDGLGLSLGSPSPSPSPRSSTSMNLISEENERAIINDFNSPWNTTTRNRNWHEPQLLPLFPIHSPRDS